MLSQVVTFSQVAAKARQGDQAVPEIAQLQRTMDAAIRACLIDYLIHSDEFIELYGAGEDNAV